MSIRNWGELHEFSLHVAWSMTERSVLFPGSNRAVAGECGNAEEPGLERREGAELTNVGIGFQECVLCQIVAQHLVAQCKVEQETSYWRLVFTHQLVESPPVAKYRHLCHECYIAEPLHAVRHSPFSNHLFEGMMIQRMM